MIRTGKITVYVKAQELKPELMTEPEVAAILECVHDLFRIYGSKTYFEGSFEEDLLLHCFQETPDGQDSLWIPFPSEWATKTVKMSNGKEFKLIGDKIPVTPRQFGLSPWEFVELKITNYDDE